MTAFNFLGGSFNGRSPGFDAQRTVNLYAEASESGSSRSNVALIGTPGLAAWATLTGGAVRGMIRCTADTAIVIAGATVWRLTAGAAASAIGAISFGTGQVSMAFNGTDVMVVTGGVDGYFITLSTNTVTAIVDPDYLGGVRVDFLDGFFVWNVPGTGKFQITQLYGESIDPLDFATAEGAPDNLVSLICNHRELWLFGETTTEVWYDAGGSDFPLQRIQGAFIENGCAAAASVTKLDNSVFWLATDDRGFGTIQRASGYTPQRVSNHAVEVAIASYSTISDAVAYTYAQEGHAFYVISFPTGGATWCLDVSNGQWHERAWRNPSTGVLGRHRSNCQMNFAGATLVGDWELPLVYTMDLDVYTDNGAAIERIRQCPHITNDGKYTFFQSLELFMDTGLGLATGQGENPQAMLQWSDDGARNWSNEVWTTMGRIGETQTRVKWRRLGKSRDRVWRVSISDPIPVRFTGASMQAVGGR